MQIGLIDVDGHNGFPNLALMKIAAWHREHGDNVAWWNGFLHYDRVYLSKVFTFTQDCDTIINADEIITGGTGYKDFRELPAEVESVRPDYSIYPNYQRALGFLTRGCIRICPWCIVPQKEGNIHPAATWQEIRRPDSREIVFLDNNVLASSHGLQQIEELGHEKLWVDFNQGLDARLISLETAALLARLHWIRFVRMSCDTVEMLPVVEQAAAYMREAGVAPSRFWAYMLVQDVAEAERRAVALDKMGVTPFAQPYRDYDGGDSTHLQKRFAEWVNKKSVFKSCRWNEFNHMTKRP